MVSSDCRSWCGPRPPAMWRSTSDRWMDARDLHIYRFLNCFPTDPAQQLPQGAEGDQEQGDLQHHRGHQQGTHPPLLQNAAAAADEQ